MRTKQRLEVDGRQVTLTNLEKPLYPAVGFTKAAVIHYYARAAEWILPHLKDRPMTLHRFPDGVGQTAFYEKDAPRFTPDWVAIAPVPRRGGGKPIRYIMVNDRPTLIWCANIASLEFHPFLHRAKAIDAPTAIVFDLDPGDGTNLITCAEVGFLLRNKLKDLGLECFAKVSGSKGLQIYVPLNTRATYAATQPFAKGLADLLAKEHPNRIVTEMAKRLRPGKVFIDWSQNSDFKTTVAVYSLRAKGERPFVSLPVTWEELDEIARTRNADLLCIDPDAAIARLEKVGDLFEPLLRLKQKLPVARSAEKPSERPVTRGAREQKIPKRPQPAEK